jgi:hypothetical protein
MGFSLIYREVYPCLLHAYDDRAVMENLTGLPKTTTF